MVNQVAIFVDGDNVNNGNASRILTEGYAFGALKIAKVYGNKNTLANWDGETKFQTIFSGDGKNAADLHMAIDALEFVLTMNLDVTVICSSDGDFSHLAWRLREHGKKVVGMGETKTPKKFQDACNEFVFLKPAAVKTPPPLPPNVSKFDLQIREAIAEKSVGGKGIKITDLAIFMRHKYAVKISDKPKGNWRGYLKDKPTLYDLDPRGSDAMVRYLPKGFGPDLKLVKKA